MKLDFRLSRCVIEECINYLLNARAPPVDHVRRKLLIQEFAKPAVLRRIEKQHEPGKDLVERLRIRFALRLVAQQ